MFLFQELASTGKLRFTDEIEAVRREAEKLNGEGVDIIVVLSHCGIDIDRYSKLFGCFISVPIDAVNLKK